MTGDAVYVRHILDAIATIQRYVAVGREVFMTTSHWQDAVIRQLEIIGEATKQLSQELVGGGRDVGAERANIPGMQRIARNAPTSLFAPSPSSCTSGPAIRTDADLAERSGCRLCELPRDDSSRR
jgi:hypothetical protein